LLALATTGFAGCQAGGRGAKIDEALVLHGVSVLEFDGVNLRLKRASDDSNDLALVIAGQEVDEAELRIGDRFVLTNKQGVRETYQVLVADEDRVTLKKQEVFDRRANREGIRTVESVITLAPYNLEETE
jgi:hypothetical protein